MNNVLLIGRLTKDPEMAYTPGSGHAVAKFGLAVDRNFKNAEGKYDADFINIVCWRKLAEHVANNLGKGRLVAVGGRIETSSYAAQDGTKRYKTEVVADEVKFLDWPKEKPSERLNNGLNGWTPQEGDDDIPF